MCTLGDVLKICEDIINEVKGDTAKHDSALRFQAWLQDPLLEWEKRSQLHVWIVDTLQRFLRELKGSGLTRTQLHERFKFVQRVFRVETIIRDWLDKYGTREALEKNPRISWDEVFSDKAVQILHKFEQKLQSEGFVTLEFCSELATGFRTLLTEHESSRDRVLDERSRCLAEHAAFYGRRQHVPQRASVHYSQLSQESLGHRARRFYFG